ncbi:hypothetical protein ACLB6W_000284 [Campylobacter jejuni]|nr:hypothetical protein [Campylobacter jejuni]
MSVFCTCKALEFLSKTSSFNALLKASCVVLGVIVVVLLISSMLKPCSTSCVSSLFKGLDQI